jgi:hypothetical protein
MIRRSSSNLTLDSGSSACEILDANSNLRDVPPVINADFSSNRQKASSPPTWG